MSNNRTKKQLQQITSSFPSFLIEGLRHVSQVEKAQLYISGGTIRDWLLNIEPADLDITVESGAVECCRCLLSFLGKGALVMLGTETEEAARVVWQGVQVDFSSFRKGAKSIEEELTYRDYTINSMALAFEDEESLLIDPLGGMGDLQAGHLRNCFRAFSDDPLRMLRGYRLQAELGCTMVPQCVAEITEHCHEIDRIASERILYELDRIMLTNRAALVISGMAETGLLWQILPELHLGVGVEQPGFHHEDVFHHNLLALECVERVIERPQNYFFSHAEIVADYLKDRQRQKKIRYAALFHDLGKPATQAENKEKGRVTFYNHDRVGRLHFEGLAERLRMSRADAEFVGRMVEMHMHPFHLSNVYRESGVSRKALLRICRKAGEDLPGLFVLAMADSLAGQGELKPPDMEDQLAGLYDDIEKANRQYIQPVLQGERLLTGHDLIHEFRLEPGPLFKEIFAELELAQVEERVNSKEEAREWLRGYLDN